MKPITPISFLFLIFGLTSAFAQAPQAQSGTSPAPDDWPPPPPRFVTVEYAVPSKLVTSVNGSFLGVDGRQYETVIKLLEGCGIKFPPGSSAVYLPNAKKMVVRNNVENQNLIGKYYDLPPIPPPVGLARIPDIIIPKVSFKDATVRECVGYLHEKSVELDDKETDPKLKGVNIIFKLQAGSDIADKKVTLELTNVSLKEALRKLAEAAGIDVVSDMYAIILEGKAPTEP